MSQHLTLELSDEIYASLEKKASSAGLQVSEWIICLLNQQAPQDGYPKGQAVSPIVSETAFLSEQALAEDWNKPEEDAAWARFQPEQ